jgi:hypothetical protein
MGAIAIAIALAVVACGGGGGGDDPPAASNTTLPSSDDGTTFKQVMNVGAGPRLYLGASTDGPLDTDGYPERLSTIGRTKE